jgi:tetratricopeptide (TPR) repeat protein
MVFTGISLISLSLLQLTGDAFLSILGQIPEGVAGNFAQDVTKLGLQSVLNRCRTGNLGINNDIQRAARRASLQATLILVRQYRQDNPAHEPIGTHAALCDSLTNWLAAEAAATRDEQYRLPPNPFDDHIEELVIPAKAGGWNPGPSLQKAALREVIAELESWLGRERERHTLGYESLPESLVGRFHDGWPYVERPLTPLNRLSRLFTEKRGSGARMVRRAQAALPAVVPTNQLHWFPIFAAFFTEELKINHRAHAIFDASLLLEINDRAKQNQISAPTLNADQLATALTTELESWGQEFCSRFTELGRLIKDGNVATLNQLADVRGSQNRDSMLLAAVREDTLCIRMGQQDQNTKLDRIEERLIEVSNFVRGPVRLPRQLPPSATAEEFFGRREELAELTNRLSQGLNCAIVGPAGLGKTALAAEAVRAVVGLSEASLAASPFPDGVVLLDLYQLKARADDVFGALARAFLGPAGARDDPRKRVSDAVAGRRALVIIEGAEEADGTAGRAMLADVLGILDHTSNRYLVLTRDLAQSNPPETITLQDALNEQEAGALLTKLTAGRIPAGVRDEVTKLLAGHPLALTWAGSQLKRENKDPRRLVREWTDARLPSGSPLPHLNDPDPRNRAHTLEWLYNRSVRGLNPKERTVLAAAGFLAHAPFPLIAMDVGLGESALAALDRLVEANLLRWVKTEANHWEFTHVLAYRFSRRETNSDGPIQERLAHWLHDYLVADLQGNEVKATTDSLSRILLHVGAILRTDEDQKLWRPLAENTLYYVCNRLNELGRLDLVGLALDGVSGWLQCLPEVKLDEPFWLRERSIFLNKFGDLNVEQGNLIDAQSNYRTALNITTSLTRRDPSNTMWRHDLSLGFTKIGEVHFALGDLRKALSFFEEGLIVAVKLAEGDPANRTWQWDLCVSLNKIGDLHVATGDLLKAQDIYENAQRVAADLVAANPYDTMFERNLGISFNKLGDVLIAQGDLTGAQANYESEQRVAVRLAAVDSTNTQWQRDLAISFEKLGDVHLAQLNLGDAETCYDSNQSVRGELCATDPTNALWQRDLSISLSKLGNVYSAQGRFGEAMKSYVAAMGVTARLAAVDTMNATWKRDLAICQVNIGSVHLAQGNLGLAEACFEEGRRDAAQRAASDPMNAGWLQDLIAVNLNLGDIQFAQGKLLEAEGNYEAARNEAVRRTLTNPLNTAWQRDLGICLSKLGEAQLAQRKLGEAQASFETGRQVTEMLISANPSNADWQRDMSIIFEKLGDVQMALGSLAQAHYYYHASQAIRAKLAIADSRNPVFQQDLTLSNIKLGNVQFAQGNLDEALVSYEAVRQLSTKLTAADPSNPAWQRDLFVGFVSLARVAERRGHLKAALLLAEQALPITERLAKLDPSNPCWQNDVCITRSEVARLRMTQPST